MPPPHLKQMLWQVFVTEVGHIWDGCLFQICGLKFCPRPHCSCQVIGAKTLGPLLYLRTFTLWEHNCGKGEKTSVGYNTNTGCLAGIGKLQVLCGWYFGWYYWLSFCLTDDLAGTPFLNNLVGPPIFLKKGARMHQKGGQCPLLSEKGVPAKFTVPKLPTKFSFGISMVNTRKIPTDTNQKYQIGIKLYIYHPFSI